jgi:hypothetical protein
MSEGLGEVSDEVHGEARPGSEGNGVRLEEARGSLSGGLDALTGSTRVDIGTDGASHARPPEVRGDGIEGFQVSRVSRSL